MKLKLGMNDHEYIWGYANIVEFDNFEDAIKDYAEKYDWGSHDGGPCDGDTTEVYIRNMESNITSRYVIEIKLNPTYIIRKKNHD